MEKISALSIITILCLSSASILITDNQVKLDELEFFPSPSMSDCSNQTHVLGNPFHVDNQLGNDSNPGTIDCPLESISEALNLSSNGDEIIINEILGIPSKVVKVHSSTSVSGNYEFITGETVYDLLAKSNSLGTEKYMGKAYLVRTQRDFTKEYILEKFINLKKEISIVICRFGNQKYEIYEPIENVHEDQILKHSKIPAEVSETIKVKSKEWAKQIVEELDYIGTLCVEFFIDKNENLYVNEIAPRVHNSGHLTINSHNVSQFENHIRAVCGLEKIDTKKIYNAQMINLIGDDITIYRNKTFKENEFYFDY